MHPHPIHPVQSSPTTPKRCSGWLAVHFGRGRARPHNSRSFILAQCTHTRRRCPGRPIVGSFDALGSPLSGSFVCWSTPCAHCVSVFCAVAVTNRSCTGHRRTGRHSGCRVAYEECVRCVAGTKKWFVAAEKECKRAR